MIQYSSLADPFYPLSSTPFIEPRRSEVGNELSVEVPAIAELRRFYSEQEENFILYPRFRSTAFQEAMYFGVKDNDPESILAHQYMIHMADQACNPFLLLNCRSFDNRWPIPQSVTGVNHFLHNDKIDHLASEIKDEKPSILGLSAHISMNLEKLSLSRVEAYQSLSNVNIPSLVLEANNERVMTPTGKKTLSDLPAFIESQAWVRKVPRLRLDLHSISGKHAFTSIEDVLDCVTNQLDLEIFSCRNMRLSWRTLNKLLVPELFSRWPKLFGLGLSGLELSKEQIFKFLDRFAGTAMAEQLRALDLSYLFGHACHPELFERVVQAIGETFPNLECLVFLQNRTSEPACYGDSGILMLSLFLDSLPKLEYLNIYNLELTSSDEKWLHTSWLTQDRLQLLACSPRKFYAEFPFNRHSGNGLDYSFFEKCCKERKILLADGANRHFSYQGY